MNSDFFIDMHCHPSIKAYARSFRSTAGVQSSNPKNPSSLWRRDPPSEFDKLKNYALGLTNFIQSDATSLLRGRVSIVCLSFYPQEKAFFVNKAGTGLPSDLLTMLATEFGQQRIDYLQGLTSYWDDLKSEMNFLQQQENKFIAVDGKKVTYSIARSYSDIELPDQQSELGATRVIFVPTIEGAHVFDQVMDSTIPWDTYPDGIPGDMLNITLERIKELRLEKGGLIRPLFITLAHHFWNGLCGHAQSLTGAVKCVVDQSNGLDKGFTRGGEMVIHALLDDLDDQAGNSAPPILIDIKHMSRLSREQYFTFLDSRFPGKNIPVIASHAAVTGLSKPGGTNDTAASQEGLFRTDSINFFDDEVLRIDHSNGIFGIQLDERRIGSKNALRSARGHLARRKILYSWAKLVWNQVRHVAELLDKNGRFAWGIQSLGTDFDGIIDPINGYWTSEDIDQLDDYLLKHAYNYIQEITAPNGLVQIRNKQISPEEIVDRVMTGNALDFLARVFK